MSTSTGSIRSASAAWRRLPGVSPRVLSAVRKGIRLPFVRRPSSFFLPNHESANRRPDLVTDFVSDLVSKGVLRRTDQRPTCVSPIKLVPKRGGKFRMVVNLMLLNSHLHKFKYREESVANLANVLHAEDHTAVLDLADGFWHLHVHPAFQRFLGVCWRGQFYVWQRMPQGLSISPYWFSRVLTPVVSHLRTSLDVRLNRYVDDFLVAGDSSQQCSQHLQFTIDLLEKLGWSINRVKSVLEPSQQAMYLGFRIDTRGPPRAFVPKVRLRNLLSSLRYTVKRSHVSARPLSRLLGRLVSCLHAVLPIKLYLRNAYRLLASRRSWRDRLEYPPAVIRDFSVLLSMLSQWNGRFLLDISPSAVVTTDASDSGWGGTVRILPSSLPLRSHEFFQADTLPPQASSTAGLREFLRDRNLLPAMGWWSRATRQSFSINVRELLAVVMTLVTHADTLRNRSVLVRTDNVATAACINRIGSMAQSLNLITRHLMEWCRQHKVRLHAMHFPGDLNQVADHLSRIPARGDWTISPQYFRLLHLCFPTMQIDRFAATWNHKLPRFNSMFPQPLSEASDSMTLDWSEHDNYINPPFSMMERVVGKLLRDRPSATVVVPTWTRCRWFRQLQRVASGAQLVVPPAHGAVVYDRVSTAERHLLRSLGIADRSLQKYFSASLAPSTRTRRARHVKEYLSFCEQHGCHALHPESFARFLVARCDRSSIRRPGSTWDQITGSLGQFFRAHGIASPAGPESVDKPIGRFFGRLKNAFLQRHTSAIQHSREPLDDLSAFTRALDAVGDPMEAPIQHLRDATMALVTFLCGNRPAEVSLLCVCDLHFLPGDSSLVLDFLGGKTMRQRRQGLRKTLRAGPPNFPSRCPVQMMRAYLTRTARPRERHFDSTRRSRRVFLSTDSRRWPLSASYTTRAIGSWMRTNGIDATGGHLRATLVSLAIERGVPWWVPFTLGGWSNHDAFERAYLNPSVPADFTANMLGPATRDDSLSSSSSISSLGPQILPRTPSGSRTGSRRTPPVPSLLPSTSSVDSVASVLSPHSDQPPASLLPPVPVAPFVHPARVSRFGRQSHTPTDWWRV